MTRQDKFKDRSLTLLYLFGVVNHNRAGFVTCQSVIDLVTIYQLPTLHYPILPKAPGCLRFSCLRSEYKLSEHFCHFLLFSFS